MKNEGHMTRAEFLTLGAAGAVAALIPNSARPSGQAERSPHPTDSFQLLKQSCRGLLTLDYQIDDGTELVAAGHWMKARGLLADTYGKGAFLEGFERRMAGLLGFEAACFMPTGVMAQLIALRIFADEGESRTVGMHPSSHHLLHEQDAYRVLHQLESEIVAPWERPILAEDIRSKTALCALSVELPVRWIGGQLQTWSQLQELKDAASSCHLPLLMDGARLWECQPYYQRSYADICQGFSAVYVSFYKMIGALNGALLAGSAEFIQECRVWRRRMGGDVYQSHPYVASSAMRIDEVLPRLADYRSQAVSLCKRLAQHPDIVPLPELPATNLFRLILPGNRPGLMAKRDALARERGIWVGDSFRPTRIPGLAQVELQIGPGYQSITEDEAVAAFESLI